MVYILTLQRGHPTLTVPALIYFGNDISLAGKYIVLWNTRIYDTIMNVFARKRF